MKWSDLIGPNSLVSLWENPELASFLANYIGNPHSCSLHKEETDDSDLAALRQVIFDSLGEIRRTPDETMGRQTRVTLKIPYREKDFTHFRRAGMTEETAGNVDTYITCQQLTSVLGDRWTRRGYKTSTETFIIKDDLIHLSWGYKDRNDHDHSECQR